MSAAPTASRLQALARGAAARPEPEQREQCELCGADVHPEHRHVVDLQSRALLCACRACAVLLGRPGAGGSHFRLVPERRLFIADFQLDDARWDAFGIPVGLAFFFRSSAAGRVVAFYPSPLGATESLLELDAWEELERANPLVGELADDVEALLVNRTGAAPAHFLAPIDECYALVGLIRSRWKGLGGGDEVWREIGLFFDRLRERATAVTFDGKEVAWGT